MANVSIWHAVYLFRKDYFLILHVRVTPVALLPVTHTFIIKKWFKIIKGRYALNDDFSLSNARLFTPLCYVHSFTFSSSFLSISTFAIYKILQKIPQAPFLQPLRGPTGILPSCAWTAHFHRSFSDAHVRATMSALLPCVTHMSIYKDTLEMMGCCATPDCQNKNNFPLENYFVSSISPRLFCLRQCYCIALNKIKRRLSFDSLRYARRQVSSLYGFDDGGLFIASLIA